MAETYRPMTDTQIVNAIKARMDGRFDDPDLLNIGALHDRIGDIAEILTYRQKPAIATTEAKRQPREGWVLFARLYIRYYFPTKRHGGGESPIFYRQRTRNSSILGQLCY